MAFPEGAYFHNSSCGTCQRSPAALALCSTANSPLVPSLPGHVVTLPGHFSAGNPSRASMFPATGIIEFRELKQDGRSAGFGIPYRSYVGTKTAASDFIMQDRALDSLDEDLGACSLRVSTLRVPQNQAWPPGPGTPPRGEVRCIRQRVKDINGILFLTKILQDHRRRKGAALG